MLSMHTTVSPIYIEDCVSSLPGPPVIHYELLGVYHKLVAASDAGPPPVEGFIIVRYETHHGGVVCKLHTHVCGVDCKAVMCEQAEEGRAQHMAQWCAGFRINGEDVEFPILTTCGCLISKTQIVLGCVALEPSMPEGTVLKADPGAGELGLYEIITNQHPL